jgi:RNA polymerase sigma-70 factor (ECF subfamily)
VDELDWLTQRFEENRSHLRAVAFRMLGSSAEAEDAVQEAWLRLARSDVSTVDNLGGWLTTVVARISLDLLRARRTRREEPMPETDPVAGDPDPEREALLADAVGPALLVVLDTLAPAERLAFVLHDLFAVPFDEIATILDRSPASARQLASRARRRVQGAPPPEAPDPHRRREVVAAFLTASRTGDMTGLLALLHPDVTLRADGAMVASGADAEVLGPDAVAGVFAGRAKAARLALLDGEPGLIWQHRGEVRVVFAFTVVEGAVTDIEMIGDPGRLAELDVVTI